MRKRNPLWQEVNWYLTEQIYTMCRKNRESLKTVALECNVSINTLKNMGTASIPALLRVCRHFNIDMLNLMDKAIYNAKLYTT